jgi:hypothetical protein
MYLQGLGFVCLNLGSSAQEPGQPHRSSSKRSNQSTNSSPSKPPISYSPPKTSAKTSIKHYTFTSTLLPGMPLGMSFCPIVRDEADPMKCDIFIKSVEPGGPVGVKVTASNPLAMAGL